MKLIPLCLAAATAFCLTVSTIAATPSRSIVGTWTGVDDQGVEGGFVFSADGTADMLRNGDSFRQKSMKPDDSMTYRFDGSVTPMELDLVLKHGGTLAGSLPFIVEFVDDRTIRLRQGVNGPRPKNFENAKPNEIIVLHRPRAESPKAGK